MKFCNPDLFRFPNAPVTSKKRPHTGRTWTRRYSLNLFLKISTIRGSLNRCARWKPRRALITGARLDLFSICVTSGINCEILNWISDGVIYSFQTVNSRRIRRIHRFVDNRWYYKFPPGISTSILSLNCHVQYLRK